MAYRTFSDVAGLQVEVEDDGGGAVTDPSLGELLAGVGAIVAQAGAQLGQLPAGQRPTEMSLAFGLHAVSGGYAVGLDAEIANFRVSLVWSQEPATPDSEIPGFPGL